MTREQAIKLVDNATCGSGTASERIVASFEALGLIKFDEPLTAETVMAKTFAKFDYNYVLHNHPTNLAKRVVTELESHGFKITR